MKKIIMLIGLLILTNTSFAGWFSPSTKDECINKYKNQVVWSKALNSVIASCYAVYVSDYKAYEHKYKNIHEELDAIGDLNKEKLVKEEEEKQNSKIKKAAKCFISSAEKKEIYSKESALKAATNCSDDPVSLRFLTWSFRDE